MWIGYDLALAEYFNTFFCECVYNRDIKIKAYSLIDIEHDAIIAYPAWLGDERLHASHRSNLLRKDKEFYSKYQWKEDDSLPYYWPSKESNLEDVIS